YCGRFKNKYERYAGRFAAKEAAMKALGTGWRRGVKWVDFEVVRETSGRPTLAITGEAAKIAQQLGVKRVALSITHTTAQARAQVILRVEPLPNGSDEQQKRTNGNRENADSSQIPNVAGLLIDSADHPGNA